MASPGESPTISRSPFLPVLLDENDPDYARVRRDRAAEIEALSIALGEQLGASYEAARLGAHVAAGAGTPAALMSPPPGRASPSTRFAPFAAASAALDPTAEGGAAAVGEVSATIRSMPIPWQPWYDPELYPGLAATVPSRRQSGLQQTSTPPLPSSLAGTGRNSPVVTRSGGRSGEAAAMLPAIITMGLGGSASGAGPSSERDRERERRYGHGRGGATSSSMSRAKNHMGSLSRMPSARGGFINGVWYPENDAAGIGGGGGLSNNSALDEGGFFRRASDNRSTATSRSSTPEAFVHNPSAPIGSATPTMGIATPQAYLEVGAASSSGLPRAADGGIASGRKSASRSPVGSNQIERFPNQRGIAADIAERVAQQEGAGPTQGGPVVHLSFEVVRGVDIREAVRRVEKWKDERAEIEAAIPPEELPPPRLFSACSSWRQRRSAAPAVEPEDSDLPNSATRMLLRLYYSTIRPPDSSVVWWHLPTVIVLLAWAAVVLATAGRALADARRLSPAAAFVPLAVLAGSVCLSLGLLSWAMSLGHDKSVRAGSGDEDEETDHDAGPWHAEESRRQSQFGPRRLRTMRARSSRGIDSEAASAEEDQRAAGKDRAGKKPGRRRRPAPAEAQDSGSEQEQRPKPRSRRAKLTPFRCTSSAEHDIYTMPRASSVSASRLRGPSTGGSYVAERRRVAHGSPGPPPTMPPPPAPTPDLRRSGPSRPLTRSPSHDRGLQPKNQKSAVQQADSAARAVASPPAAAATDNTPTPTPTPTPIPSASGKMPLSPARIPAPPSPTRTPRPSSSLGQHGGRLTVVSPTPPPGGPTNSHSRLSMTSVPAEGPLAEEDEGGAAGLRARARSPRSSGRVESNGGGGGGGVGGSTDPQFTTLLHAQPSMDELHMRERHRAPGSRSGAGQLGPNLLVSHSHSASSSASSIASSASWPPSKREYGMHLGFSHAHGQASVGAGGAGSASNNAGSASNNASSSRDNNNGELWVSRVGAFLGRPSQVRDLESGSNDAPIRHGSVTDQQQQPEEQPSATPMAGPQKFLAVDVSGHDLGTVSPGLTPTTANMPGAMPDFVPTASEQDDDWQPRAPGSDAMAGEETPAAPATWSYTSAAQAQAQAHVRTGSCSSLSRPRSGSASGFGPSDDSPSRRRSGSRAGSAGSIRPRIADFRAHQAARRQYVLDVLDGRVPMVVPHALGARGSGDGVSALADANPNTLARSHSMSAMSPSWQLAAAPRALPTVKGSGDSRWSGAREVARLGPVQQEPSPLVSTPSGGMTGLSAERRISLERRATSPLRLGMGSVGLPLRLDLDLDGDDSDEVDVQPVPASHRVGLGISMSDGNRSSGDTPDGPVRRSREGQRASSSLSSVYSFRRDFVRESAPYPSQAAAARTSQDGGSDSNGKGKARRDPRLSRDRALSESASAYRRRDRTSTIAEDPMMITYDEPWRRNSKMGARLSRANSEASVSQAVRQEPGGSVSGAGTGANLASRQHSPVLARHQSRSPPHLDLHGLGIGIGTGLGLPGGASSPLSPSATAAAGSSSSAAQRSTRSPVELPRLSASLPFGSQGLVQPSPALAHHGHGTGPVTVGLSPSGGAAGTNFPSMSSSGEAAARLGGRSHEAGLSSTLSRGAISMATATAPGSGNLSDSAAFANTTETRSTFKFLRLDGPEDEAFVENFSQRPSVAVDGGPVGSKAGPDQFGGVGAIGNSGSNDGSFGRKVGLALGLRLTNSKQGRAGETSENESDGKPHASGAHAASATLRLQKVNSGSAGPRAGSKIGGLLTRSEPEKRWVIIRGFAPVVRSSAERGVQERDWATAAGKGKGNAIDNAGGHRSSSRPSAGLAQRPSSSPIPSASISSSSARKRARARARARARSAGGIVGNPIVLVLTLAVNVLTIGALGAGMALSALLLQATPALGNLPSSIQFTAVLPPRHQLKLVQQQQQQAQPQYGTASYQKQEQQRLEPIQASELRVGRGGAIFGLALGGVLVLAVLARLSCLLTQVIWWRCQRRKEGRRSVAGQTRRPQKKEKEKVLDAGKVSSSGIGESGLEGQTRRWRRPGGEVRTTTAEEEETDS
ncbi:hypothetical protein OC842_001462 [Tilletia horrida]|uniref:Transmembrane protein n=1 Tax=Tilletia horrida TaxID=155126 RepID=A0AAN6GFN2_9BASI|nr:hypothetical protein OC842_001462 [Tilletia horrida]